jgi:hypothetical protein
VSLLGPTQAFVDNPSVAIDAAVARALAGHIASRILVLTSVLGRTMNDANLNAAYSMRSLFAEYDGPHIRVRRSGDDAESDVTFDLKGMVLAPADWAIWSATRTLVVPIIYD